MHKQVKRFLRRFDTEHKVKAPKVRNIKALSAGQGNKKNNKNKHQRCEIKLVHSNIRLNTA